MRRTSWSGRRPYEPPASAITPEALVLSRRRALGGGLIAGGLIAASRRARALAADPRFPPGRPLTEERWAESYNNYYEFSDEKDVVSLAARMPLRPWTLRIEGMVGKPQTLDLDQLLAGMPVEERIYRHRCVEAWAMTVPWSGFPLKALLARAEPQAGARYVVFESASLPKVMPGLREPWYPWPYQEGLTLAEAVNELAFIATGLYGKPLPPQNGGAIRLVVPWKYGFKSAKAIVRITLTDKRPSTFWSTLAPDEYGFWANVNPAVPHPRWSQATERLLGSDERVPTQIYNGYGEWVASLYSGLSGEQLFR